MNWFRFYHEALDDPKVQRLSPIMFKNWINLLCLASKSQPRGVIPALTDVCFSLRVSEPKAIKILNDLVALRLMDEIEKGRYSPHNWEERQKVSDSSAPRVQRYRERQNNNEKGVTGNVSVTLPKRSGNGIEIEEEIEIEKEPPNPQGNESENVSGLKVMDGGKGRRHSVIGPEFDRFWQAYPKKRSPEDAEKAWRKLNPDDSTQRKILDSIAEHKQTEDWKKQGGQFIPYPATFLSKGMFRDVLDEEASQSTSKPKSDRPYDPVLFSLARERQRKVTSKLGVEMPAVLEMYDRDIAEIDVQLHNLGLTPEEAERWLLSQ